MGHYIESSPGVKLFVEDLGAGQPVVFLHGWPLNHLTFESQMLALPEAGYRFIGVDMRGYGKSDKPYDGYDYDTMADDVYAIFKKLNLKDAVLAGFSMGGGIAVRYMSKHEGYGVSKLMLLSAAAPLFTKREDFPYGMKKEEVDQIIKKVIDDRPSFLNEFGGLFFHQKKSKEFMNWFQGLGLQAAGHSTIQSAIALRDEDLRSELDHIHVPTTIFHGKKDKICPFDLAEQLHKHISESTLVTFEHSGHGTLVDEPKKFNQELINFLAL